MSFYGYENAPEYVRNMYDELLRCWCVETCAVRLRPNWSERNPSLGQCSISSFLFQDIYGGEVWGIPLEGGGVHCFNRVDGFEFDLTSEQFSGAELDYSTAFPQTREEHWSDASKYERYLLLKERFEALRNRKEYYYVTLRQRPELKDAAAEWFNSKWGVPVEAYLECMDENLSGKTELGWYLCLWGGSIVGGCGVIVNDFHDRPDLTPNICAVYTEEAHRCRGIAGRLLNLAVEDLRAKKISPVFLLTDHEGFYERYGWEFYCLAQGDGEDCPARMYVHY